MRRREQKSFKRILELKQNKFREALRASRESLNVNVDQESDDCHGFAMRITKYSRTLLVIEQALHRVANGNYGRCCGCNDPIPMNRLKAIPWALNCVNCERMH